MSFANDEQYSANWQNMATFSDISNSSPDTDIEPAERGDALLLRLILPTDFRL